MSIRVPSEKAAAMEQVYRSLKQLMDNDWLSPDQAKVLLDAAVSGSEGSTPAVLIGSLLIELLTARSREDISC